MTDMLLARNSSSRETVQVILLVAIPQSEKLVNYDASSPGNLTGIELADVIPGTLTFTVHQVSNTTR